MNAVASASPSALRWKTTPYRLESPPTGETFEFVASSRTAADHMFRFVWTLAPGKRGPGEHVHEVETESFEVVSGVLRIWIRGVPKDYHPGDSVSVPPNTPHRFLNPGEVPTVVNVSLDGPSLEDAFVPLSIATHGREPKTSEMLRMFVRLAASPPPSTPVSGAVRALTAGFVGALRLFGVRAYDPVHGWDA